MCVLCDAAGAGPASTLGAAPTSTLVRSDVVEEYNKAVELWQSCTHPSFPDLHAMLTRVRRHVCGMWASGCLGAVLCLWTVGCMGVGMSRGAQLRLIGAGEGGGVVVRGRR